MQIKTTKTATNNDNYQREIVCNGITTPWSAQLISSNLRILKRNTFHPLNQLNRLSLVSKPVKCMPLIRWMNTFNIMDSQNRLTLALGANEMRLLQLKPYGEMPHSAYIIWMGIFSLFLHVFFLQWMDILSFRII